MAIKIWAIHRMSVLHKRIVTTADVHWQ